MSTEDFDNIATLLLNYAEKQRMDVAYSGGWGDGGAGPLEDTVHAWQAGLQGKIPDQWKSLLEKIRPKDAEYQEYLRLKAKFDGTV